MPSPGTSTTGAFSLIRISKFQQQQLLNGEIIMPFVLYIIQNDMWLVAISDMILPP